MCQLNPNILKIVKHIKYQNGLEFGFVSESVGDISVPSLYSYVTSSS